MPRSGNLVPSSEEILVELLKHEDVLMKRQINMEGKQDEKDKCLRMKGVVQSYDMYYSDMYKQLKITKDKLKGQQNRASHLSSSGAKNTVDTTQELLVNKADQV